MSGWKKGLVIAGVVVGVLVALAVAAVLLLPAERIGRIAVDQAEATLDREVRIEDFGIRILPRPAVTIEGMAVSRHARPEGSDDFLEGAEFEPLLASVQRIDLRPRLLPLLRGDVVIHEIVLDVPHLRLVIREDGTLDIPTFETEDPEAEPAEIEIRRVLVRDGRVEYRDEGTGLDVAAAGIQQRLGLTGAIGRDELLVLEGTLSIDDLTAHLPADPDRPLEGLTLALEHEAAFHQGDDRLDVQRLDLALADFPVGLTGTVEAVSDPEARTVSLTGRSDGVEVARLLEALPPALLEGLPQRGDERLTATGGMVDLDATVSGRAGAGEVPEVDGRLRIRDGELAFREEGRRGAVTPLVDELGGEIVFSLEAASSERVAGRLLGEPFHLAFQVADWDDPRGTARVDGALDLAEAGRLGLLPDGVEGRGRVVVDLSAEGPVLEPAAAGIDGTVRLDAVDVVLPDLARSVTAQAGRIDLHGSRLVSRDLRFTMGESDLALEVEADEWLPFLLDEAEAPPTVRVDARSERLDLDDLFDADPDRTPYGQLLFAQLGGQEIDGRGAPEIARDESLSLPEIPDVVLDGRFRAGTLVNAGQAYDGVDATVTARGGDLEVPAARLGMMGGEVQLSVRLGGPADGGEAGLRPLTVNYTVSEVTADPFLHRHTLFRGHVGGSLLLTGSMEMGLHPNTLPEPTTVAGEGTMAILEGELRNWPLVRELGRRIGVAEFETEALRFQDWGGRFRIADARFLVEESGFEAEDVAVRFAGSFDVAGNLDFGASFDLPVRWVAGIPGVPAGLVASILADPTGRVPIGANVGGSTSSPSIDLDFSEAGARIVERARESWMDRLGVDPPGLEERRPEAADTLRDQVEEEVRDRLRRLLRGGGGA